MVQVAFNPLTIQGLDTTFLLCLRDCRHTKFQDSLLGMIESSLCEGPVYFNFFPNFSIPLSDPNILQALTLQVKTHNYSMLPGSQPIFLRYRLHYKVMRTISTPTSIESPKEETLLVQANPQKSNVIVPKTVRWNQITHLEI